MGMFWELFQELQINKRKVHADTLQQRVADLENELRVCENVLAKSLTHLESLTGQDFTSSDQLSDQQS